MGKSTYLEDFLKTREKLEKILLVSSENKIIRQISNKTLPVSTILLGILGILYASLGWDFVTILSFTKINLSMTLLHIHLNTFNSTMDNTSLASDSLQTSIKKD